MWLKEVKKFIYFIFFSGILKVILTLILIHFILYCEHFLYFKDFWVVINGNWAIKTFVYYSGIPISMSIQQYSTISTYSWLFFIHPLSSLIQKIQYHYFRLVFKLRLVRRKPPFIQLHNPTEYRPVLRSGKQALYLSDV